MLDKMMNMVNAMIKVGDANLDVRNDVYYVVINDFEGFDDDWGEVLRDYADEAMVDQFLDWFYANEGRLDFAVRVNFMSEDI